MDSRPLELEAKPVTEPTIYRGIEIDGVSSLEEKGILGIGDIRDQIDKLPARFFTDVPLGRIEFLPYSMFSVERDGEIEYVREEDLLPSDRIIARKRAVTGFNKQLIDGVMRPTDGKMTIKIFSTTSWESKGDQQFDKDVALYALNHEFGHAFLNAVIYGPGIFDELERKGIPLPSTRNATDFSGFIDRWSSLPESTLPRYKEYEKAFAQEHKSDATGYLERSLDQLAREEDFGISLEHFLYWNDLRELDPERFDLISSLFDQMSAEGTE